MSRGLSGQQGRILGMLKECGEDEARFPWMSTREIVMVLHPEVQAYLDEEKGYGRIARANLLNPHLHKMYLEHVKKLKALPNYHTARTSVNRALRILVRHGLVARQEHWGMFQHEGKDAGWLLAGNMSGKFKEDPELLKLRHKVWGSPSRKPIMS